MCITFSIPRLIGNVIGVIFVNLTSPLGSIDLISCIVNVPALYCIILFKDLKEKKLMRYIGSLLYAAVISAYVVWVLNFAFGLPFSLMYIQVLIAEAILASVGIFIFSIIEKRTELKENSKKLGYINSN